MHLNHRTETTRLNEIVSIRNSLNDIFEKNTPQIWTGDFNALTKEDYSSDHWNEITEVRAKDNWELLKKLKNMVFRQGILQCPYQYGGYNLDKVNFSTNSCKKIPF